uniref:Uncharacterized protein n=1 Tax=Cacopsylla melanoneura TaxID=428564 RepID=A0A8D8WUF0_9HEMI
MCDQPGIKHHLLGTSQQRSYTNIYRDRHFVTHCIQSKLEKYCHLYIFSIRRGNKLFTKYKRKGTKLSPKFLGNSFLFKRFFFFHFCSNGGITSFLRLCLNQSISSGGGLSTSRRLSQHMGYTLFFAKICHICSIGCVFRGDITSFFYVYF